MGLYEKILEKQKAGYNAAQTAKLYNCTEFNVKRCYKAGNLKIILSEEEKQDLATGANYEKLTKLLKEATEKKVTELYIQKISLSLIAKEVGVSKPRICQILREISDKDNSPIYYSNEREQKSKAIKQEKMERIQIAETNKKVFKPQKVVYYSKSYLDITGLFIG